MKGFKKDGKFRPTGNKSKSSVSKNDVKKRFKKDSKKAQELKEAKEHSERQLAKEQKERRLDFMLSEFNNRIIPFGSADVWTAMEKGEELGMRGEEIADLVEEYQDSIGEVSLSDIDIVALVYEHELQTARNHIDDILGYDLSNDTEHGDTEIYVAGNYMATGFDYSEGAIEELQEKVSNATGEQKDALEGDHITKIFLEDVEIDLDAEPENDEDEE